MHEQEYRKTIELIEKDIDTHSTRPLELIQEHDENALLLMGVDPTAAENQEALERDRRQKAKNEALVNQKHIKTIHSHYEDLQKSIAIVQNQTARVLVKDREKTWATMDRKLDDIKQQLKAEQDKK